MVCNEKILPPCGMQWIDPGGNGTRRMWLTGSHSGYGSRSCYSVRGSLLLNGSAM